MKSAVVAITPTLSEEPEKLERLCRQISELQSRGLLGSVSIASVMHPDLYPFPSSYYQLTKFGLSNKNQRRLEAYMMKRFKFRKVHMLNSPSSENLTLAEKLSDFAKRRNADVLVVNQARKQSWLRRLVNRVAEVTALSAALPVLVLDSESDEALAARPSKILLAVDPRNLPSDAELTHVANAAMQMGAEVHIVHVRPANRSFSKPLNLRLPANLAMKKLGRLETYFARKCISSKSVLIEEDESIAASIEKYAADHQVCMTAVTLPKRSILRRLLAGSTATQLLRISNRPVFILRPNPASANSMALVAGMKPQAPELPSMKNVATGMATEGAVVAARQASTN